MRMPLERRVFESLVRDHHAAVYRSARRVVRRDADALDVTQQVFLRVLEGKIELARAADPGRVLRFYAARSALQHLRGDRNRRRRETEPSAMATRRRDDAPATPSPESRETERELPRFVDRLPEDLRLPIAFRFNEGLTFAEIAEALDCSEGAAHDRVRRGLDRLRGDLAKAGFASLLVGLEARLASAAAEPPVPTGLEGSLLSLAAPAFSIAPFVPAAAVVALALGAGGGVLLFRDRAPGAENAPNPAVVARAEEEPRRDAPPQAPPAARPAPATATPAAAAPAPAEPASGRGARGVLDALSGLGTISGSFVDESGLGVAGAAVEAHSAERAGKLPRFVEKTTTGDDGAFVVRVPVRVEDGQIYALVATHPEFVGHRASRLRVKGGETLVLDPVALVPRFEDREGPFVLDVLVSDESGLPVEGAAVTVHRSVRPDPGGASSAAEREASGTTDGSGRARLLGTRVGEKRLVVDARSKGFARHDESFPAEFTGSYDHEVVLGPALEIRGRIEGPDGRVPKDLSLVAWRAERQSDWIHAAVSSDGEFRLAGLDDAPYVVSASADGLSPFRLDGVPAGRSDLDIVLKRRSDPRDVGSHLAEIHGTLRDAATGELVLAGWDDIDVERLPDLPDDEIARDVFPTLFAAVPRQVAIFGAPPAPSADVHVAGLDPGVYAVVARVKGFAPAISGPFRLGPNEIVRDVVIRVERGVAIEGSVSDPAGRPVEGAHVFLVGDGAASRKRIAAFDDEVRESAGRGTVHVWGAVRTDATGRFRFERVPERLPVRAAAVDPRHEPAVSETILRVSPGARVSLRFAAARER